MVALGGCNVDYGFLGSGEPEGGPPIGPEEPIIEVQPTEIDFGMLVAGEESAQVVTITNKGRAPLQVSDIRLDDVTLDYSIIANDSDRVIIQPDDQRRFTVTFAPMDHSTQVGQVQVESNDPDDPLVPVDLTGSALAPDVSIDPSYHDFGTLDVYSNEYINVLIESTGTTTLIVEGVDYTTTSDELSFDARTYVNGDYPWHMEPGDTATVRVRYMPLDSTADEGHITVVSNDPDNPSATANQQGSGLGFDGFYSGWYVYDDGVEYETTSNPSYIVSSHGDEDLYWYEPSGAHGLIDSSDPEGDFAIMAEYVLDHAGEPEQVEGPFYFEEVSTLSTFEFATFTYFMCEYYLPEHDDPSRYEITSGFVDDGIQVMSNSQILGRLILGSSGSWPLDNAWPGEINQLIIILADDSASLKYVHDLAFYRDGVMIME